MRVCSRTRFEKFNMDYLLASSTSNSLLAPDSSTDILDSVTWALNYSGL